MRQDMHQLTSIRSLDICGQRKLLSRGVVRDLEELPTRQSMRSSVPHYINPRATKLTPALRWLERQAGRPWNDVYAELRTCFDTGNVQQAVVLEGLMHHIERDVFFVEGKPTVATAYGTYPVGGLYVHPDDGQLLLVRPELGAARASALRREAGEAEKASRRVQVSPTLQLHRVDGLWFWVELAPITAPKNVVVAAYISKVTGEELVPASTRLDHDSICRDALTGRDFFRVPTKTWEFQDEYQAYGQVGVYAKRKWQASRRDVARHVAMH